MDGHTSANSTLVHFPFKVSTSGQKRQRSILFFFQPFAKFVAKCGMIGIEFVTSPSMKNRAAVYAEEGKEYLGETMLT